MRTNNEYLHQSGLNLYHRCAYLYDVQEHRGIRRRFTPKPLRRGTLIHNGFEGALRAIHRGDGDPIDLGCLAIERSQDEWLALPHIAPRITGDIQILALTLNDDAQQIFERSFKALGILEGKWRTVVIDGHPLIEEEIQHDDFSPYWKGFQGTLDWVATESATGYKWLFDWKSRMALKGKAYDTNQRQAPLYQYLLKCKYGVDTSGTCTYQIRACIPTNPKININGTMSRSKNVKTDWPTYREALITAGLDPDDYKEDMEPNLKPFDQLTRYYRPQGLVSAHWRDAQGDAANIATQKHWGRASSQITCQMCYDQEFCNTELRGGDIDFLLDTDYMVEGKGLPKFDTKSLLEIAS